MPAQGSGRGGLLIKQIAIHHLSTPVLDLGPQEDPSQTVYWNS